MSFVVDVPGQGAVDFGDEETARSYFKKQQPSLTDNVSNNPLMTFADQATREFPPNKLANAITDKLGDVTGLGKYDVVRNLSEERAKESPLAATLGKTAGQVAVAIPEYMAGMGALKAVKPISSGIGLISKLLRGGQQLAKGAGVNVAIGQGANGYDPSRIAMDAALGGAGEAIQPIVRGTQELAKKVGTRVLNSALKTPKAMLKEGKNLGAALYDRMGLPRTRSGLEKIAETGIAKNEAALQNLLKETKQPITVSQMRDQISKLRSNYEGVAGFESERNLIDETVKTLDDIPDMSLTASEANQMKRKIYKLIQSKAYKTSNPLPIKTDIAKAQARGLRQSVEDVAPASSELNKELAYHGQMKDRITDLEASGGGKALVKLLPFLMAGGAGGGAAYGGADPKTAASLAAIPLMLSSTPGKMGAAGILKGGSWLLNKLAPYIAPTITGARK